MKVYVMVDAEGISGIYSPDQVRQDGARFAELRKYMTQEINACVKGLKEGGADGVVVYDCHGGSWTVLWEELTDLADGYVCGDRGGGGRMPGVEGCDAVVLLGYHARAGTAAAVLEHTMSSVCWQNLWISGVLAGETHIDACIAGEHGLPVILVTGDDKVCTEAAALIENVVTAQVKTGLSSAGAVLLPPAKARALIREKAAEAVRNAGRVKPLRAPSPVTLRLELVERNAPPDLLSRPGMRVIDGRTYEVTAGTVEEALMRL